MFSIDTLAKGWPESQSEAASTTDSPPHRSVACAEFDSALEVACAVKRAHVRGDALGEQRHRHLFGVGHVRGHDAVRRAPQRMSCASRSGRARRWWGRRRAPPHRHRQAPRRAGSPTARASSGANAATPAHGTCTHAMERCGVGAPGSMAGAPATTRCRARHSGAAAPVVMPRGRDRGRRSPRGRRRAHRPGPSHTDASGRRAPRRSCRSRRARPCRARRRARRCCGAPAGRG